MDTQVRIGKDRKEKDKGLESKNAARTCYGSKPYRRSKKCVCPYGRVKSAVYRAEGRAACSMVIFERW